MTGTSRYRYAHGANVLIHERDDASVVVSWTIDDAPSILRLRLRTGVLEQLLSLPSIFTLSELCEKFDYDPAVHTFLDTFLLYGILIEVPTSSSRIRVTYRANTIATWNLPCQQPLTINILAANAPDMRLAFAEARRSYQPSNTLLCPLLLSGVEAHLGPCRHLDEAQLPPMLTLNDRHYPDALEQQDLEFLLPNVKALLADALITGRWHDLASHGLRITSKWSFEQSPLRRRVKLMRAREIDFPYFFVQAQVEDGPDGTGVARSLTTAEAIATGEAFERYALSDAVRTMPRDLRRQRATAPPGSTRFPYLMALWPPSERVSELQPWSPRTDTAVLPKVPRNWVYFDDQRPGANSNGAAAGVEIHDALEAAFREVVERDLLLRCWLGLARAVEMDDRELATAGGTSLIHEANKRNLSLRWFRLDSGALQSTHVVACLLFGATAPYASMGAACKPTLSGAVEKAFFEAAAVERMWSDRVEVLGRNAFMDRGVRLREVSDRECGLVEMGWIWAGDPSAPDAIPELLCMGDSPRTDPLTAGRGTWWVDVTPAEVHDRSVVKILDERALPLPNNMRDLGILSSLTGASRRISPIPIT
jgi:hypothetical protein